MFDMHVYFGPAYHDTVVGKLIFYIIKNKHFILYSVYWIILQTQLFTFRLKTNKVLGHLFSCRNNFCFLMVFWWELGLLTIDSHVWNILTFRLPGVEWTHNRCYSIYIGEAHQCTWMIHISVYPVDWIAPVVGTFYLWRHITPGRRNVTTLQ